MHRGRYRTGLGWVSAACAAATLAAGCTQFKANGPLENWEKTRPLLSMGSNPGADDTVLILAFSGGGTRAAAFSYGVLEELRDTVIEVDGRPQRLLDEVDVISGVSGGSFTAAYYGLFGDRIFDDFEKRFLRKKWERRMWRTLFNPVNWVRLASPGFNRSDLAAELYDKGVFERKTVVDFGDVPGPAIVINATDFMRGSSFSFTREHFDPICNELLTYPIARAVAASAAVPGPFPPLRVHNYAGTCGYQEPEWIDTAVAKARRGSRRYYEAVTARSYVDGSGGNYVWAVDGGITDNLGIRSAFDRVVQEGSLQRLLEGAGFTRTRQIVIIVVNAQTQPELELERLNLFQSIALMTGVSAGIQIRRFNFETIELVRRSFENWTRRLGDAGRPAEFQLVELNFSNLRDDEERRYFNNLPTSLSLDDEAIDRLRETGRRLLRESPEFQKALRHANVIPAG